MTSTNIYTIPYFYIIQHKESKKLYAGSKWAKGCHPDEFMQPNGYTTSSLTINSIIDQDGLTAFEILRIDTYLDGISAYDYESLFLQCLDCASSPDWYNGHNNSGMSFGLPEFYEKTQQTLLKKYGVVHNSKLESTIIKIKQTKLKRYDDENYNNSTKNQVTCLEKYGNYSLNISRTNYCIENNVINVSQISGISKKVACTKQEKYGSNTYNNRNLASITTTEKYGVDNWSKTNEARTKVSIQSKKLRAQDVLISCPYCNKQIKGKMNFSRWHGDKCKLKP